MRITFALLLVLCSCAAPTPREWADEGALRVREKNWDEAARCYSNALTLQGGVAEWWRELGLVYVRQGKLDLALSCLKDGERLSPLSSRHLLRVPMARVKFATGDQAGGLWDAFVALADRAQTYQVGSAKPPIPQADLDLVTEMAGMSPVAYCRKQAADASAQGNFVVAVAWYRNALYLNSDPKEFDPLTKEFVRVQGPAVEQLLKAGHELRAKGDLAQAIEVYKQAAEVARMPIDWYHGSLIHYLGTGDVREALASVVYGAWKPPVTFQKARPWQRAVVDGRDVTVWTAGHAYREFLGLMLPGGEDADGVDPVLCFELRDSATEEVLMPMTWTRIALVPGVGVFFLPVLERYQHHQDSSRGVLHDRIVTRKELDDPSMTCWRQFDVNTRISRPSDVIHIQRHIDADPLRPAHLVIRRTGPATLAADAAPVDGKGVQRFDDVQVERDADARRLLRKAGAYVVLRTGKEHAILNWRLETLGRFQGEITTLSDGRSRFLAVPAPGSAPVDDLWHLLAADGGFRAPPGALGVRPIGHARWKADGNAPARQWLVKYEGGWGLGEWDLSKETGPYWDAAELLPPVLEGRSPTYVDGRDLTIPRPKGWYDHGTLLVQRGGAWTATAMEDRDRPGSHASAEGKTRDEALSALKAKAEPAFVSDQKAITALAARHREEHAKAKAEYERIWATGGQQAREQLLNTKGGSPQRWAEAAMGSSSPEFVFWTARKLSDPERKKALHAHWFALVMKSTSWGELKDALALLESEYEIADRNDRYGKLSTRLREFTPGSPDEAARLERERAAKVAAARQAEEAARKAEDDARRRELRALGINPDAGGFGTNAEAERYGRAWQESAVRRGTAVWVLEKR